MSQEKPEDMINWVEHEMVLISKCGCGEHHFHLIKIGSAVYLQCGRCGRLTSVILDYHTKNNLTTYKK